MRQSKLQQILSVALAAVLVVTVVVGPNASANAGPTSDPATCLNLNVGNLSPNEFGASPEADTNVLDDGMLNLSWALSYKDDITPEEQRLLNHLSFGYCTFRTIVIAALVTGFTIGLIASLSCPALFYL